MASCRTLICFLSKIVSHLIYRLDAPKLSIIVSSYESDKARSFQRLARWRFFLPDFIEVVAKYDSLREDPAALEDYKKARRESVAAIIEVGCWPSYRGALLDDIFLSSSVKHADEIRRWESRKAVEKRNGHTDAQTERVARWVIS